VIGPERAKVLATRYDQIRARTIERFEQLKMATAKARPNNCLQSPPEPVAADLPVAPTNGVPAQESHPNKPTSWWRRFIFGGAEIPKAEAILALRMILNEAANNG
jgi:hypothetical protein